MPSEIEILVRGYQDWLRDQTSLREVGDWTEITTPYLDRHNDRLQIYAKRDGDAITLTDDGYIIDDLATSGCELNTDKRQQILKVTLNGFGVSLQDQRLEVRVTPNDFARKKHDLIQAMMAVNDLFYLSQASVASFFFEDVRAWLEAIDARFSERVRFTGKSGFEHTVDFLIPHSRSAPERIVQAVSNPNKDHATNLAFKINDIREVRETPTKAYALINDLGKPMIAPSILHALGAYEITPVMWSDRNAVRESLAR